MTDRPVHPVADLFPMLADDELQELAEDIKQRGLLHPIVLDAEGRVLDGRNRLAACRIAKVEPSFVDYDGDDPAGYALAVNIQRRNLTKGQQAMVLARSGIEYRNDTQAPVSKQRVSHARVVREHAPDLVDAVIAGATGLDEAYRIARERKTAADSVENQLARLRAEDPELATKVVEGELTLAGAWAERKARTEEQQRRQRVATSLLCDLVTSLAKTKGSDTADLYAPELANGSKLTARVVADARDALAHIAATLSERGAL